MSNFREHRAKEIQDAIRQILYRDWDPIGVCDTGPIDEYDSYIGSIYRLLISKPKREGIVNELRTIEDDSIGVGASEEALILTAEKLLALNIGVER